MATLTIFYFISKKNKKTNKQTNKKKKRFL